MLVKVALLDLVGAVFLAPHYMSHIKKVVVYGLVKWNVLGHPISVAVEGMDRRELDHEPTIEEMSGLVEDFTEGMSLKDYLEDLRNG